VTGDQRYFEKAYWNGPKAYNTNRNASGSFSKMLQRQADATFSYTKDFSEHHMDLKAGYSYYFTRANSPWSKR
jgi:3-methyladenine DNA glycosylase AlkC